ncbi:MAG: hypothetical protein PT118_09120 [Aphanizomenon gracile PMC644.10]|nr:hypothetical protein [Aphanizomenon gracile PMC644.10]
MAETNTTENLTQAKEYLTIALEVVKSAEIKNDIAANLELLKSRTGTSGGNRSRGVQKTLYMRFHENSMKNVIDLIFLGHLKFAKSLYRFANRFPANLRTIR